jgi:hypothetical protein
MSFTKTISVFAALASIFGAGAAGWKLAQDNNSQAPAYEKQIEELKQQVSTLEQQATNVNPPPPVALPTPQEPVSVQAPKPTPLPPPPVPPAPPTESTP